MKLLNLFFILSIIGLFFSCEKSESEKNNEAELLKVTCDCDNAGIDIDTITNTVIIKVLEITDITKIILHIEISKNATIYPPSGVAIDFSNPATFTITSGDKTTKNVFTVIATKPLVQFTVYDCSSWITDNFSMIRQSNANINLYTNKEDVETTKPYDILNTDQNGQVFLYYLNPVNYYCTVEYDNKSNIVYGYALKGIYTTQQEVAASPPVLDESLPDAKVGNLKFRDVNGDGVIDSNDKTNHDVLFSQHNLDNWLDRGRVRIVNDILYRVDNDMILRDLYIADKNLLTD